MDPMANCGAVTTLQEWRRLNFNFLQRRQLIKYVDIVANIVRSTL